MFHTIQQPNHAFGFQPAQQHAPHYSQPSPFSHGHVHPHHSSFFGYNMRHFFNNNYNFDPAESRQEQQVQPRKVQRVDQQCFGYNNYANHEWHPHEHEQQQLWKSAVTHHESATGKAALAKDEKEEAEGEDAITREKKHVDKILAELVERQFRNDEKASFVHEDIKYQADEKKDNDDEESFCKVDYSRTKNQIARENGTQLRIKEEKADNFEQNDSQPDSHEESDFPPSDLALATIPGTHFDPKTRHFSLDELKPQPMIKKRRKTFVPAEAKDDKYWSRRQKNNIAARRSREARRLKENQIALRAAYLEKENSKLRLDVQNLEEQNESIEKDIEMLSQKLQSYEVRK